MSTESNALGPLMRRVITGLDTATGTAKVIYDDAAGNILHLPNGNRLQTIWFTDQVPADCSPATNADPTGNKTFQISNEGSVGTIVWMRGGSQSPMHQTKSIDYAVVLEGEIELILNGGETRVLKPGDIIVQRETVHAWRNPHPTKWAKMFSVLIASKNAVAGERER